MTTITLGADRSGLKNRTNPFSVAKLNKAIAAQQDKQLYEDLTTRLEPGKTPPTKELLKDAVNQLKERMGTNRYSLDNFGRIEMVPLNLLDINIDNQRDVDWDHVAHIIKTFDPRAAQVVNTIKLENGRYSVPEGQHTAVSLKVLYDAGLLPGNFEVQCKVIDALATVPGSELKGEAFGNFLFRLINYKGRKAVEPFYMHKSRVSGVRNYGSTLVEDVHAERIQTSVEQNNMYCRPAIDARGHGAKPGMITYISGLNKIAGLESDDFDNSITDLDNALRVHDRYFANEKGVDGGFILAFGRYFALARKSKLQVTPEWEQSLITFFKEQYASPSKFHKTCKTRLEKFNKDNNLPTGWSDACLLSVLIIDFYNYCVANGLEYPVLDDKNINKYYGI